MWIYMQCAAAILHILPFAFGVGYVGVYSRIQHMLLMCHRWWFSSSSTNVPLCFAWYKSWVNHGYGAPL